MNMNGFIDRESALAYPFANGKYDLEHADPHFINGCISYREYLETLPVFGKWTPITDGLPKKDGKYFVTDINGEVVVYVFRKKGNSEEYWKRCVLGWMPYPAPMQLKTSADKTGK